MRLPPHTLTRDWLLQDDGEFFNYNDEDEFGEIEDTVYILVGCFFPPNTIFAMLLETEKKKMKEL